MIGKIIFLPFLIISKVAGVVFGSVKLILSIIFGVFRFVGSHLFGAVIGALVGILLGRKHIGVKIFDNHKKHHNLKFWDKKKK